MSRPITHNLSKSREYRAWVAMLGRCASPRHQQWARYGGRGIRVCERWQGDFEAFFADLGPRPVRDDIQLGLLDPNDDFKPGNAAWLTRADRIRLGKQPLFELKDGKRLWLWRGRLREV